MQALEDRTLPSTFTWTGADVAGGNANWSDPNNWAGGVAPARAGQPPAPNTNLVFPTLPPTGGTNTTVDDLAAGSRISSITFSGVGYDITAALGQSNSLSVAAINDKGNGGGNGLDSSLTLLLPPGVPTVVQVTNTHETLIVGADVSDASGLVPGELVKTGAGAFELHGADTSAGPTLINQGLLATASDLGSGTITVAPGATLGVIAAGFAVGETQSLILGGTLYFGGGGAPSFSWSGSVVLSSSSAQFDVSIDEPLTVSGTVSGSFPLDKTGTGNLILTNGANSFNGATVAGGTLTVEAGSSASAGGLGRPTGGTTVDAGATLALEPPPSTGRPPTLGANPNSSFSVGAPPAGIIVVQAGLTLQNGATLDSITGVNAWNGAITLPPSVGFTGRLSPSLLEVDDGRLTVNGIIGAPAGELVKTGPGELHLPDINTFSGGADIREGTVVAETTGALGAASNTVTVADGATLGLLARPLLFPLPVSITVAQKLILNGQGVNNEGALFNEVGNNTVSGSVSGNFEFIGVAAGSQLAVNGLSGQGLVEVGGGMLVLPNNDPNYQGPTIVLAGTLAVDAANALGASGSDTVIMDQFTQLLVGKAVTVGAALTLEADSSLQLASGADWSGPVALDGTATVSVPSGSATIAGDISGTEGAALEIFGSLTLTGFDTYDGITDVFSGTLTVQSFLGNSDVFVESGATLQGGPQATLGSLTAEFGSTVIGKGETVDGSVNLASGSTFIAENSSASQPALVVTAGTVTLNGNLAIAFGFSPSKGVPITLIANHTGRAVNGQFAGLPEGGTLKVQVLFFTFTYRITYLGSPSGHDVVLTLTGSTFG